MDRHGLVLDPIEHKLIQQHEAGSHLKPYTLPGGGMKCTLGCVGPIICSERDSIISLSEIKPPFRGPISVKGKVVAKSELRKGVSAHDGREWIIFDFYLEDKGTKLYVTAWENEAKFIRDIVEVGKTYYFLSVRVSANIKEYSKLETAYTLQCRNDTVILPAAEEIPSLFELCLQRVGKVISLKPKGSMDGILSLPPDIRETLLTGKYLTFEALHALYYSFEMHSAIPSFTMTQYIQNREACLHHALYFHNLRLPYQDLLSVYDNITPFHFTTRDELENKIPKYLVNDHSATTSSSFPIAPNFLAFRTQFHLFTRGILEGLKWDNLFCAGGCVLAALQSLPPNLGTSCKSQAELNQVMQHYYDRQSPYWNSDIDIFVYGLFTIQSIDLKLREIFDVVSRNLKLANKELFVVRTSNTVTIATSYPYRHIQIVLLTHFSPASIIQQFDVDCACVGYNGDKVWASPRAIRAITRRYNLIDIDRRTPKYAERLYKYSKRGFCVAIPSLPEYDHHILRAHTYAQHGIIGRILLFDEITAKSKKRKFQDHEKILENEDEDEGYTTYIPWGPDTTTIATYTAMIKKGLLVAVSMNDMLNAREIEDPDLYWLSDRTHMLKHMRLSWHSFNRVPEALGLTNSEMQVSPYYERFTAPLEPFLDNRPSHLLQSE